MNTQTIQRQYDELIAAHYDLDPQAVLWSSLERAIRQIRDRELLGNEAEPFRAFDVGMGTGHFLAHLKKMGGDPVQPFGLDLSEKMVAIARDKVPDLVAVVDNASNLDAHFPDESFQLISTHFVTGYVPMRLLAPKIWARLAEGGYWSLVAGTMAGFPALQAKADGKLIRWLYGGRPLVAEDIVCNPAGHDEVVRTLEANGFAVRECQTFEPPLSFGNLEQFMEFAYQGGWLTPFVEAIGLHQAGLITRLAMNWFFFPVEDHHSIEIVLAQKV